MSPEDEVRQASDRFYAALNHLLNGDAGPMREVWLHSPDVTLMYPMGGRKVGWEQVGDEYKRLAACRSGGAVTIRSPLIRAVGDLAYETGIETGENTFGGPPTFFGFRVTNIYRREAGVWKMVHHHTDLDLGMIELLKGLQSPLWQGSS